MRLLYGNKDEIAEFVAVKAGRSERGVGQPMFGGPFTTIGVTDDDGTFAGAMVYHNYHPEFGVIEMSGAALDPKWLTPFTLRKLFQYPFDELHCQMVVMRVEPHNPVRRQLRSYGFKEYRIPRLRGRDKDEIIFTLTDDDWRENKFMKRLTRRLT